MHILCVGISHRTANVELREKLNYGPDATVRALRDLHAQWPNAEFALLSTCNRTELYVARPLHGHPRVEQILQYIAESRGVPMDAVAAASYHHDNERAVRHLMRVASGLDSMVLGENQILSQVRKAYETARDAGVVGRVLHAILQASLGTAKQVRTDTRIGEGRTSVSSVAVDFARHLFSHFQDKKLLVIGAGKMTELTLRHFRELSPGTIRVCNRSLERAQQLARECGGHAEPIERLADLLVEADIVISSTGSERPIITKAMFKPLLRRRKFRPLFLIDIAVPRDIESAVGEMANVYLYDMDDLQQAVAMQMAARGEEVQACEAIIDRAVAEAYRSVQTEDYAELIRRLRQQLHDMGALENRRTLNRLRTADGEEAERILDEHTQRVINKILHRPLSELGRSEATEAAMNATALRRLFALEREQEDLHPPESTER